MVIGNTPISPSSGTLSFWVPTCELYIGMCILHVFEEGRKQERRQKSRKKEKEEGRKGKQEEQGHPLYILTPDRPPRAAAYYNIILILI